MEKFKSGDKVRRIAEDTEGSVTSLVRNGEVYIVDKVDMHNYWFSIVGIEAGSKHPFCGDKFELVSWQPKNGEQVIVNLARAKFIGMDGGKYVCKNGHTYTQYNTVSQVPKTHTVTIDGKTAEISAESMIELRKLLIG